MSSCRGFHKSSGSHNSELGSDEDPSVWLLKAVRYGSQTSLLLTAMSKLDIDGLRKKGALGIPLAGRMSKEIFVLFVPHLWQRSMSPDQGCV